MLNRRISLSVSLLGLAGPVIAAACSSSSVSSISTSTSSSTGVTVAIANTSETPTSTASAEGGGGGTCAAASLLIDNMSDPTGAQIQYPAPGGDVAGSWFTDNCGSGCPSTVCPGLEQTPSQSSPFFYTPVGTAGDAGFTVPAAPGDAGDIAAAACTWGTMGSGRYPFVAEGFNFAVAPNQILWNGAPGGTGATGAGDAAPPTPIPVDIGCHNGIQFWAYGEAAAGAQTIAVMLADKNSSAYGGVCNPNSVCPDASATACSPYQFIIHVGPGWSFQQVSFAALVRGTQDAALDLPQAYSVFFQEETPSADAGTESFGFCIADITFF